jgi:hypothetical protein
VNFLFDWLQFAGQYEVLVGNLLVLVLEFSDFAFGDD